MPCPRTLGEPDDSTLVLPRAYDDIGTINKLLLCLDHYVPISVNEIHWKLRWVIVPITLIGSQSMYES